MSFPFPPDPDQWFIESRYPADAPPELKRQAWDRLRKQAGNKLYEILEQNPNPAVVEIDGPEILPDDPFSLTHQERIGIRVQVTRVSYNKIEMHLIDDPDFSLPSRATLLERLLHFLTELIRDPYEPRS